MNMESPSPLLAAALRYAKAGVYVFPVRLYVRGNGKKGVAPIDDWDANSSCDAGQIKGWWGERSACRDWAIGIDCGRSGIVGIDQDVIDGKSGIIEWDMLAPTPTWRVKTPTGGAHDYYRADPEHPVTVDNVGTVADGVDIRGQGGFLFAPPSIDPRGGSWEWVAGEPDWEKLPIVPPIVAERMAGREAKRRSKSTSAPAPPHEPINATLSGQSSLFAQPSEIHDFGPDGGYKTREEAYALLSREHQAFVALTSEGSARSHRLSQRFGALAGHGVDVFWTYEWALDTLMGACRENGFSDANGEGYARGQAERGLEYGMRERWVAIETSAPAGIDQAEAATPADAVTALIGEMLTLDELENAPPPKFLIHGFLQFDSESWLIGAPGSKKSFVAYDMAARVVRGEPWQGRRTNPADVVFIVAEGASGHGKRVKAWRQRYGRAESEGRRAVYTLPRPVQSKDFAQWAVLVGACRRIAGWAAEAGRGLLVVIDTQARVTVGLKENDNGEMNLYVEAVSAIRRATGACVLTIHHTAKNGGNARGASVIDGAQTTELKVESEKGKLVAKLSTEKQKDVDEMPPLDLAFDVVVVGQDQDGEALTSLVLADRDSVAFKAAWASSEVDGESEVATAVTPYAVRTSLDPWIASRGRPDAVVQHWVVQALVDTAETLGLTQAEVRAIVQEKRGVVDSSTFRKAWQKVTEDGGVWSDVISASSGARWTVDRVSIRALQGDVTGQ
jgi:hypothetical protein